MILAVTGLLGAGKTTVSKMFRDKGAKLISPDRIGWNVLEKKKTQLTKAFGKDIIKNRKVNRKKLAKIVFNNKTKLNKLNSITHPSIIKEIKEKIKNTKKKHIVIDVALYRKLKINKIADKKLVVRTTIPKTCERLKKYKKDEVLKIISMQRRNKRADFRINNNFQLTKTQKQVNNIWDKIKNES